MKKSRFRQNSQNIDLREIEDIIAATSPDITVSEDLLQQEEDLAIWQKDIIELYDAIQRQPKKQTRRKK